MKITRDKTGMLTYRYTAGGAARMRLKVTFDASMPGKAQCSNYPRKGTHLETGRWIVYDADIGPAALVSDHDTFELAARACNTVPGTQ